MTALRSILFVAICALGSTAAIAQQVDMKKIRKIAEEEGWGKPTITVLDQAQVAALWEAKRQSNPAEYEGSFKEWREAVAKVIPRVYRWAMANRNEANVKCPAPGSKVCYGALNLYEMFARFQAVKIFADFNNPNPTQIDPQRDTDFYLPDYQMAVMNKGYLFSEPKQRLGILLHVFLGASGYDDDHYQLKVALEMLEMSLAGERLATGVDVHALFPQNEFELNRKPKFAPLPKARVGGKDQTFVAGGFTGTNSGGDSRAGWVKSQLLLFVDMIPSYSAEKNWPCHAAWKTPATYVRDIQSIQIEYKPDLLEVRNFRRIAVGRYEIGGMNIISSRGTDILKEPGPARSAVIGIMEDMCYAKYANGARP